MSRRKDIVTPLHRRTARDYVARMMDDKVHCMEVAKRYGEEYWDGDRRYGYGGYRYDGRWKAAAEALIREYRLGPGAGILDVGCGKGYLLHELGSLLPGSRVSGFDISEYALRNGKEEVRDSLFLHDARAPFPFADREFDLVLSLTTLHNLKVGDLRKSLGEIERVGRSRYVVVESYRNDRELFNLQCWALTCASFFAPDEWEWLFDMSGYTGDYEFIYFE